MRTKHVACFLVAFSALLLCGGAALAQKRSIPAFPGAEGFGALTPGGRGGKVIEVTNLNDSGPGSLRAACEAEGPRIVVFRVGGTIEVKRSIGISKPYITIAGQTAPGDGIAIRLAGGKRTGTPMAVSNTHDVVIRYVRVRSGPWGLTQREAAERREKIRALRKKLGKEAMKRRRELYRLGATCCLGTLDVYKSQRVILDHVSLSWGIDGEIDLMHSKDITVQWSIISEGLYNSLHLKGAHSQCMNAASDRVSLHHNLFAHAKARLPRLATAHPYDVVNNVIYNWGSYATGISSSGSTQVNLVANFYKAGPNSGEGRRAILFIHTSKGGTQSLFLQGNLGPERPDLQTPETNLIRNPNPKFLTTTRHDAPAVTTTSAQEAYEQVLARAGCTLPARDAVDKRVVADVRNGTGKIIDHPEEVGGWPALASGTPPADTDHDGMPDAWERRHGFNPADPSDGAKDADRDGYTNVEEFLNGTNPLSKGSRAWRQSTSRTSGVAMPRAGPTAAEVAASKAAYPKLRQAIIDGARRGKEETVYIDLAGCLTRGRLVAARETGITVVSLGVQVPLAWSALPPRCFYHIAKKYADSPEVLAAYCRGAGLTREADREARNL